MPIAPLPGDLEMYYDDDNFTDPWRDPDGIETIVLHHGNAKNARLWYAWPPLLARQYRVIRVDMRGFGRSTVPEPGYDWSLEGFAGDLRNLLDHLDLDKVHLIGETIGGHHRAAIRVPVSGASPPPSPPARLHTISPASIPTRTTTGWWRKRAWKAGRGPLAAVGSARTRLRSTTSGTSGRWLRPHGTWCWKRWPTWARRTCPTSCRRSRLPRWRWSGELSRG